MIWTTNHLHCIPYGKKKQWFIEPFQGVFPPVPNLHFTGRCSVPLLSGHWQNAHIRMPHEYQTVLQCHLLWWETDSATFSTVSGGSSLHSERRCRSSPMSVLKQVAGAPIYIDLFPPSALSSQPGAVWSQAPGYLLVFFFSVCMLVINFLILGLLEYISTCSIIFHFVENSRKAVIFFLNCEIKFH